MTWPPSVADIIGTIITLLGGWRGLRWVRAGGPRRWRQTVYRLIKREVYVQTLIGRIEEQDERIEELEADAEMMARSHAVLRERANLLVDDLSAVLLPGSLDGLPSNPTTTHRSVRQLPAESSPPTTNSTPRPRP